MGNEVAVNLLSKGIPGIRRPRQTQGGARQGIRQAKTGKFRHTTTRSSNLAAGAAGTIADDFASFLAGVSY